MRVNSRSRRRTVLFGTLLLVALIVLTGCPADGGGNGNGGNGGNGGGGDTTPPAQAVSLNELNVNGTDLAFMLANTNDEAVQVGIAFSPAAPESTMIEFDGSVIPFTATLRISLAANDDTDATKQIGITSLTANIDYTLTATTFDENGNAHSEPATESITTDTIPPAQAVDLDKLTANTTDLSFELANPNSEAIQVDITVITAILFNGTIEFDGRVIRFSSAPTTVRISLAASGNTDATKQIRITGLRSNAEYTVTADTFDENGNAHSMEETGTVSTLPSAPPNLQFIARNGAVLLTWDPIFSGGDKYRVYRGDMLINTINTTDRVFSHTDTGLTNGTSYSYTVQRLTSRGDESVNSAVVTATPSATLPASPTNLSATTMPGTVILTWHAVAAAASYSVYRSSELVGTTTETTYTHTGVANGVHSYAVRTLNNNRLESVNSIGITATLR